MMKNNNPQPSLLSKLTQWLACWLSCDIESSSLATSFDFQCIEKTAKPGDVWLIEGRSRVSRIISIVTRSTWTHAALYIGKINDITDIPLREKLVSQYRGGLNEPLVIESLLDKGIIIKPASAYRYHHIRVCRPHGIAKLDSWRIIDYAVQHLGYSYDKQQLFDLARFLLPWTILPRRWRSSLFCYHAGTSTKFSCTLLLAEAFASIRFPILPLVKKHKTKGYEFIQRNPKLFTPRDFDISPFFTIIKYPAIMFSAKYPYTDIYWNETGIISNHMGEVIQYIKPTLSADEVRENSDE